MIKLNYIGKIVIAVGILSIFRKVEGVNGFGGYIDNSFEIIITSSILVLVGIFSPLLVFLALLPPLLCLFDQQQNSQKLFVVIAIIL
ncbi:MAG: hypothetical protein RLZZ175_1383 [Bacteroidota bacterium]|jgi:predicted RND superfamily exporter protein